METRSESIEFRLTPSEVRRVQRAAQEARSVSEWVRTLVLREAARRAARLAARTRGVAIDRVVQHALLTKEA